MYIIKKRTMSSVCSGLLHPVFQSVPSGHIWLQQPDNMAPAWKSRKEIENPR